MADQPQKDYPDRYRGLGGTPLGLHTSLRVNLPEAEVRRLEEILRTTAEAKLRHRVQIVLMAHYQRRHPDNATDTGTSHGSVTRWLNAYLDRGLDGLPPRQAPGATPKLTPDLVLVLRQWVIDGPAQQGLNRANWTYAEMADHLLKAKGIRISTSALQAFGAKHGNHPYRPTCKYLRGEAAKQRTARAEIADRKKRRKRANCCC